MRQKLEAFTFIKRRRNNMNAQALTIQDQVKGTLQAMKKDLTSALPSHIDVDKFIRVAQTAILTDPKVLNLERSSLYKSCLEAAQDGLLPDGKESALVPFGQKCTYMPMVAGVLKKMRNSGEVSGITAQLVYANDFFEYSVDCDGENLTFKPDFFSDRGELKGVFAQAKLKDGTVYVEVMSMKDIEAIKGASKGSKYGPWAGPFASEMMKKSAIRRLAKRLPMSTDVEQTIERDNQYYDLDQKPEKTITETPPKTNQAPNLADAMGVKSDVVVEAEVVEPVAPVNDEEVI